MISVASHRNEEEQAWDEAARKENESTSQVVRQEGEAKKSTDKGVHIKKIYFFSFSFSYSKMIVRNWKVVRDPLRERRMTRKKVFYCHCLLLRHLFSHSKKFHLMLINQHMEPMYHPILRVMLPYLVKETIRR